MYQPVTRSVLDIPALTPKRSGGFVGIGPFGPDWAIEIVIPVLIVLVGGAAIGTVVYRMAARTVRLRRGPAGPVGLHVPAAISSGPTRRRAGRRLPWSARSATPPGGTRPVQPYPCPASTCAPGRRSPRSRARGSPPRP
ncbi:MAG: hypothetical protein ACJ72N_06200 [Labedaea sp.]